MGYQKRNADISDRTDPERGANLVEFAILAPLLITLIFGIIEFSWAFAQNIDVRHGAREGARLAAVNFPAGPTDGSVARNDADRDALVAAACSAMDTTTGTSVSVTSLGGVGDPATFTVISPIDTLTGLFDGLLPSTARLSSSVEIRMEQPATWTNIPIVPGPPQTGQACP